MDSVGRRTTLKGVNYTKFLEFNDASADEKECKREKQKASKT